MRRREGSPQFKLTIRCGFLTSLGAVRQPLGLRRSSTILLGRIRSRTLILTFSLREKELDELQTA